MAAYQFDFYMGTSVPFDHEADVLVFSGGYRAADLVFTQLGTTLRVAMGTQYIDLENTSLAVLDSDDFQFFDGSMMLLGSGGNDSLTGNFLDDYLDGRGGTDTLNGGQGDDTYVIDSGGDVIVDNGGNDLVRASINYTLGAGLERLQLTSNGAQNGYGNALGNVIYAGTGDNVMNGGAGGDVLSYAYATGGVTVSLALAGAQATGGSGSDTAVNFEHLTGSAYDDNLRGNGLGNVIAGGAGNDTLNGGAGVDTLEGWTGNDFYVIDSAGDIIIEVADFGTDTVISTLSQTALAANVENLILNQTLNADGYGNALDNVFYAGAGNNVINGGAGTDTVSYTFATSAVNVWLALSGAQGTGGSGADSLANIENLDGSAFNDTLRGNGLVNRLSGGGGNDTLDGGAGNDVLIGGLGSDTFYAQTGDLVIEQTAAINGGGTDTVVTTSATWTLGANLEWLRLDGVGQNGYGNVLDNQIFAGDGNNVMNGFSGSDTVSYFYADAGVNVDLGLTEAQGTGGSGADTLLDFENLTGSTYADVLTGSVGDNIINGAAGADIIIGSVGADELTGGADADVFRYATVEDSGAGEALRDLIMDFTGEDSIDLSAIDADVVTGGDQAFTFIGGADFNGTDATGQLRYDATLGVLYGSVDADTDAEFSIALSGMPALAAEDFLL